MPGIELKTVNPKVLDDPVFCELIVDGYHEICGFVNDEGECVLFDEELDASWKTYSRSDQKHHYNKCQKCKDHYQLNKKVKYPCSECGLLREWKNKKGFIITPCPECGDECPF